MDSSIFLRQLLRSPSTYLHFLTSPTRAQSQTLWALTSSSRLHTIRTHTRSISTASLPRVLQPSLWTNLIPKFLRRSDSTATPKAKKPWNPATPYIILSLLVGSQAIQTIWLKRDTAHFMRRADAKIGLLREVVERVQRGEDVDVEKVLGTGDKAVEGEWEDVLKEIEEEELLFQSKKKRRAARQAAAAENNEQVEEAMKEKESAIERNKTTKEAPEPVVKVATLRGARFY